MLPKKRRILRKEFPYIVAKGKRYNSPHLLLYLAKFEENKETSQSRFSFSVSKKICPNAVDRNKLRRQGYSVIGKYIDRVLSKHFLFFVFKKGSKGVAFNVLEKEILELLSGAVVLE